MTKLINVELSSTEVIEDYSDFVSFGSPAALERCDGTSHGNSLEFTNK